MTTRSMFRSPQAIIAVAAGFSLTLGACASGTMGSAAAQSSATGAPVGARLSMESVRQMVAAWPTAQRASAEEMMTKYGTPVVAGDRLLVWHNTGPFLMTALHRDAVPHNFPMPHDDYLTQTVKHSVPANKLGELNEYDGSVWYHRTRGELSAQCDVEAMNLLALNISHDIITGKRTAADARAFFATTAMAFKQGDKSSPYTSGLTFQPDANAADPGRAHAM